MLLLGWVELLQAGRLLGIAKRRADSWQSRLYVPGVSFAHGLPHRDCPRGCRRRDVPWQVSIDCHHSRKHDGRPLTPLVLLCRTHAHPCHCVCCTGGFLRRLSGNSQRAVSDATAVANEVLGNIRTVRCAPLLRAGACWRLPWPGACLGLHSPLRPIGSQASRESRLSTGGDCGRRLTACFAFVPPATCVDGHASRAFGQERFEQENFASFTARCRRLNTWLGLGVGLFTAGSNLFINGVVLGVVYYGGTLVQQGQVSPGQLMQFLVSSQTVQRSVAQLSVLIGKAVTASSAGARVFEYMYHPSRIPLSVSRHSVFCAIGAGVLPSHSQCSPPSPLPLWTASRVVWPTWPLLIRTGRQNSTRGGGWH